MIAASIVFSRSISSEEPRAELLGDAKHVMKHQNLTIAINPCADSYGGMVREELTSAANFAGIFSKTIEKHPASWRSIASSISLAASSSCLALTL